MRGLRWLLALVLGVGWLVAPALPAAAASRTADLAGCVQSANTLSALFVFDQSGSLTGTDPTNIRYEALQIALEQLARLTKSGGGTVAVEVAMSAFDHEYRNVRSVARWTRLDRTAFKDDRGKQAETITRFMDLAREGTASTGGGTDFEVALDGALSDLEARGGPSGCRVLFWFTDGEFESARDSVGQARDRMCRPGGLLDRIRKQGIVVVGLQLAAESDDLRSMSEGRGTAQNCGTTPIPSDWAGGIYVRADDPAGLKRLFGSVLDLVEGCTPTDKLKNQIDPGIRRFRMTIDTRDRVNALRLDAPDGTAINAALSGSTEENGYTVTTTSDDHYVTTEVEIPSGRVAGKWDVNTDPATNLADATFCVFHDLRLELADPKQELKAGVATDIALRALDRTNAVASLKDYADVAVGASAVGPDGKIRKAAGSTRGDDLVVGLTPLPTDARLELSVSVQLRTTSGLVLTSLANRFKLDVQLAKEFPLVRPAGELDLGEAVKKRPTSAALRLVGSPVGPTRVCLGQPGSVIVPQEAAGTVPELATGCIDLGPAEARDVTISVQPIEAAEGAGSALLPVTLHSAATANKKSKQVNFDLPVVWRFSDPLNAAVLVGVILVVAALSVLVPLLAVGLANLVSAKFETKGLRVGTIPVLVNAKGVRRQRPLRSRPNGLINNSDDLEPLRPTGRRRFSVDEVKLRAHGTLNPFGAPNFLATPPSGSRIMSSVGLPIAGDRQARVSPGLGFVPLAVVSEADLAAQTDVPAMLVVLLRNDQVPDEMLDELARRLEWDRIATEWRRSAGESPDYDGSPGDGQADGPADPPYIKFD